MGIKVTPRPPKEPEKTAAQVTQSVLDALGIQPHETKLPPGMKRRYRRGAGPPPPLSLRAIGGPIESPMEKKQKPLYEEELGMYGGGAVRKKMYARGGGTRPTRG